MPRLPLEMRPLRQRAFDLPEEAILSIWESEQVGSILQLGPGGDELLDIVASEPRMNVSTTRLAVIIWDVVGSVRHRRVTNRRGTAGLCRLGREVLARLAALSFVLREIPDNELLSMDVMLLVGRADLLNTIHRDVRARLIRRLGLGVGLPLTVAAQVVADPIHLLLIPVQVNEAAREVLDAGRAALLAACALGRGERLRTRRVLEALKEPEAAASIAAGPELLSADERAAFSQGARVAPAARVSLT